MSKATKWLSDLPYLSKNNFLRETGAAGVWPRGHIWDHFTHLGNWGHLDLSILGVGG
jgi:hypothetical protein